MKIDVIPTGRHNAVVYSEDDVEPTLERNKILRGLPQKSDWGRHIATIDAVTIVAWLNEERNRGNYDLRYGSKEFDELIIRKLNDPDWKNLRTDK